MSRASDILVVLRGLESVTRALTAHQRRELQQLWNNSSLRAAAGGSTRQAEELLSQAIAKTGTGKVMNYTCFTI